MFVFALFYYSRQALEMEEATIEDEPELEQADRSSRPETSTGLLPWSYILQIGISSPSVGVTSLHLLPFDSSQPAMGGLPHHFTSSSCFSLHQCSPTTNGETHHFIYSQRSHSKRQQWTGNLTKVNQQTRLAIFLVHHPSLLRNSEQHCFYLVWK